ncbi:MAG: acylneuraminate cytidylyltransferase family protein [Cytophagales bacterium]|nr:acylneuraminate cytidylyltransferase family protein [Cytophagales bacterium]
MAHITQITSRYLHVPNVLAIIPARQGSKSVPHKNIRSIAGKPLLAHSIGHALAASRINRVIVSTDSELYADIARQHGAEVPFLRPEAIAQDHSTDFEVFEHALDWLKAHEQYVPDVCVHLRPTHPVRNPADIDAMIDLLLADESLDAVRSVVASPETPYKMWFMDEAGMLRPVIETDIREAYNQPRQVLPPTYLQNASIDVLRTRTLLEKKSMTGDRIRGYLMAEIHDIDHEAQLAAAEARLHGDTNAGNHRPKTFCFDIDGVIATLTPDNDYTRAECNRSMAAVVNALYDAGNEIILFTARGTKTGIDWAETTREQMQRWGVKYHELRFGKPAADYYIDDRMLSFDAVANLVVSGKS